MINFPWRQYTREELVKEYVRLYEYTNKSENTDILQRSHVGYKCSNFFLQYERMNTRTRGNKTGVEYWADKMDYCIERQKVDTHDLFGIVQHLCHTPSQFPPNVASRMYKIFNATAVLDPFAGWGDRCVAAMSMGIDYTGIDSNINLKEYYEKMIDFFPHENKVEMIFNNAENVDFSDIHYDVVLTSPPFWDEKNRLFDIYNNMKEYSNESFINIFIDIFNRIQQRKCWICIHIPPCMYEKIRRYIGDANRIITFNCVGNKKRRTKNKNQIYCYNVIKIYKFI